MEIIEVEFQDKKYKKFSCKEEAEEYRKNLHSDDCMDNLRFCYLPFSLDEKVKLSDAEYDWHNEAYQEYLDIKESGCCGFMDEKIFIGNSMAIIGCNFGH